MRQDFITFMKLLKNQTCAETCSVPNRTLCDRFIPFSFSLLVSRSLNKVTERKRLDGGDDTISSSSSNEVSYLGLLGLSLQVDLYSGLHGLSLCLLVRNLTCNNLSLALGLSDVLDTYMNTLLDDTSVNGLVDTYSDSRLGYVENDSSASVVVLVGHTLMDGGVGEDIDVVTNLDGHLVLGKGGKSMLTELLGKHVPGTGAYSE